jgi:hypothetical protein
MKALIQVKLTSKLYFVNYFKAIITFVKQDGVAVTVETWVL